MEELTNFIFKQGDERVKSRALLCSVFHHALHDRYHKARDMFLISHIQDGIEKSDTTTQILYNRALVTLGLSAFRKGLIQKAHECLSGVCSGKVKELLAQGQSKWLDKDPEQEKIERRRQIPYHMHINPDLLECCHLISAMLLELPVMAKQTAGNSNFIISRHFRKYLHLYNKETFNGPPENTREHVLAAFKNILSGDWQKACDLILNLDVWNFIPDDGGEKIKQMLLIKIKEEALRTYILTHGAYYESISLSHMCETFEMEGNTVRRVISRMIAQKELAGGWEQQPLDALVLYKTEPTAVQTLSQQVSEKVALLVESNERLLDSLVSVYGYKDDWTGRGDKSKQFVDQNRKQWNSSGRGQFQGRFPGRGGRGRGRGDTAQREGGDRAQGTGKMWSGRITGGRGRGGRGGGRSHSVNRNNRDNNNSADPSARRPMSSWASN
jgi:translation initiation factor 3 subunit C